MQATTLDAGLLEATPKTDEEYALLVEKCLMAINIRQQRMDVQRDEIKALQAETDSIIADVMRCLRIS